MSPLAISSGVFSQFYRIGRAFPTGYSVFLESGGGNTSSAGCGYLPKSSVKCFGFDFICLSDIIQVGYRFIPVNQFLISVN